MKLTYLPQWKVQNNSKKQFVIQEDEASISIVSPINEYAMGILSQVTFSTTNGVVTEATVENNSPGLFVSVDQENKIITIDDQNEN
ncbi:hypothetical protein MXL82_04820 [Staphylococcus gallinarum]|uniref:Uncharacterized protein n=1 Tax=Staphylococcus gallinarum TaxID=1293 RepID=A0A2T4SVP9_STAGA|nr:hypothetical protein [Staphylococcus gallinarum]MCD8821147.1 hypothetical protein [Staphylococcus gallinarum]MCD8825265.1 hypothetical protein [Staphylococcus gallinarum]MCD8872171.1 hypothetical protein [Staphylococcus gallinarum]MCW0984403.1 hypothetical protein [Staphylococcus gallinarum]MEB6242372.1 hypothetical protein [Staphylococcus gallinarum]